MKYYLYLDESGMFLDDSGRQGTAPSIVAGLLLAGRPLNRQQAESYFYAVKKSSPAFRDINVRNFHGLEENDAALPEFVVTLLIKAIKSNANSSLVEFSSVHLNKLGNRDLKYLNIFAEGVIQLLQKLLLMTSEKVDLHIIYARRVSNEASEKAGYGIYLTNEEYNVRIRERIFLRLARFSRAARDRVAVSLQQGDANNDVELMLADAVNTVLRGKRALFSPDQLGKVDKLPIMRFEALADDAWSMVCKYLESNQLAEALLAWFVDYYEDACHQAHQNEFYELLERKIRDVGRDGMQRQHEILSQQLNNMAINRDFARTEKLLHRLQDEYLTFLQARQLDSVWFKFDLYFHALTYYSHLGRHRDARAAIEVCNSLLGSLPSSWEMVDYYISYRLRLAEYYKDNFDFCEAMKVLSGLEKLLCDTLEVMGMVDELGMFAGNLTSDSLGKVYNSMTAALSCMERSEENYDRGMSCSELALRHKPDNRSRVGLSTAALACHYGHIAKALEYLYMAFDVEDSADGAHKLAVLLERILPVNYGSIFALRVYADIMAGAVEHDRGLADSMYEALKQADCMEAVLAMPDYPANVVLWKYAVYRMCSGLKGSEAAARKSLEIAYAHIENITIYMQGLAAQADFAACTRSKNSYANELNDLQRHVQAVLAQPDLPEAVLRVANDFACKISSLEGDSVEARQVLREAASSIPVL